MRGWWLRISIAGVASALAASGLVMGSGGVAAAETQTFATSGTFLFTVPADVTQITVDAVGAQGGSGGGPGGADTAPPPLVAVADTPGRPSP